MSDNQQYIVSARKYRPASFQSVVGQRNLTSTLKNAITSGRIAQAYLFCGPRGVGKTSCARIFARTINCLSPTPDGEACGVCESCQAIAKGNSFNLIELDAASNNSVDDIRSLIEQVNIPPQMGRYKVFIIDEVHMLSSQAFNAFLKTLEEPPKYAVFILATTEKHKVIPTILSRCQIYDFKRITIDDTIDHLAYVAADLGVTADRRALGVVARKADGAMRDALSIFDQVLASSQGNLTYEAAVENLNVLDYDYYFRLVDTFAIGDISGALLLYKEIRDKGFDSLFFVNGLAGHVRDLMAAADPRTLPLLEVDAETAATLRQQTSKLPLQWYYAAMKILNDCDYNYRASSNKQLLIEVALIRLCQLLKPATPPFDLAEELPALRDPKLQIISRPAAVTESSHPVAISAESVTTVQETTPQPRQSQAPSTESTNAAAKPATKPRRSSRLSTFRLTETPEENQAAEQPKDRQFSLEEFEAAWNQFIADNSELVLLTNGMRTARREQLSSTHFRVMVSHPAELKAFELEMTRLSEYLRAHLGNESLLIEAVVDQNKQASRHLPPQEFLKKIITENPELGNFLKNVNAEITQ